MLLFEGRCDCHIFPSLNFTEIFFFCGLIFKSVQETIFRNKSNPTYLAWLRGYSTLLYPHCVYGNGSKQKQRLYFLLIFIKTIVLHGEYVYMYFTFILKDWGWFVHVSYLCLLKFIFIFITISDLCIFKVRQLRNFSLWGLFSLFNAFHLEIYFIFLIVCYCK